MKALFVLVCMVVSFMAVNMAEAGIRHKTRQISSSSKSTFSDTVKKIRDDDEGIVVLFNSNSGSYYLRRDVADFEASKKKLEEAFKSKKPVSVTFDGTELNILEVK